MKNKNFIKGVLIGFTVCAAIPLHSQAWSASKPSESDYNVIKEDLRYYHSLFEDVLAICKVIESGHLCPVVPRRKPDVR